jgi:hypothetical protein
MPPYINHQAELICNKMLKGLGGKFPSQFATYAQRKPFVDRYRVLAELLVPHLPRVSSAFGAVVMKCAIKYGLPKIIELLNALKVGVFSGVHDPAFLLWQFIANSQGLDSQEIYAKSVSGCRAFCEGRTLTELRSARTDVFEWNSDYTEPNQKEL